MRANILSDPVRGEHVRLPGTIQKIITDATTPPHQKIKIIFEKKLTRLMASRVQIRRQNGQYIKTFNDPTQRKRVFQKLSPILKILRQIDPTHQRYIYPDTIASSLQQFKGYKTKSFPGRPITYLSESKPLIPQDFAFFDAMMQRLPELFAMIRALRKNKIHHGDLVANVLFDPRHGFRIIDFDHATASSQQSVADIQQIYDILGGIIHALRESEYRCKNYLNTLSEMMTTLKNSPNDEKTIQRFFEYIQKHYKKFSAENDKSAWSVAETSIVAILFSGIVTCLTYGTLSLALS